MEIESPVVHMGKPHDVYIGRPSIWGNPYTHQARTQAKFVVATRDEAIEKYEVYIRSTPELLRRLPELRGKRLGCWCAPFPCHGDVLVKLLAQVDAGTLAIP